MQISKAHIQELYKFTRQHYVVHYDLQTELVDHLAEDIETIWETKPNLSFNEARDLSFKKFGVFGFMDVVEARQKMMSKRYMKILWSFVKEWFTLPKVVITALIFLVSFTVFSLSYGYEIAVSLFVILFLVTSIKGFKFIKYIKKKETKKERLWLLEDLIFRNASVNGFLLVTQILQVHQILDKFWGNSTTIILTALFFTFIAIYSYVSIVVLPKNAEKLLKKTYPEYSM